MQLSLKQVAKALDLRVDYLSRLENGKAGWPRTDRLRQLRTYLVITAREYAECRGEHLAKYDLGYRAWRANRKLRRSRLHPRESQSQRQLPLQKTAALGAALQKFRGREPVHILLEGEIASGKSSLVEIAIEAWSELHEDGNVTVMPLGGDYFSGAGWSTTEAFLDLLSIAQSASDAKHTAQLIVIEDAHELHIGDGRRFAFDRPMDLSSVWLIVSTRPKYVDKVIDDIKEWNRGQTLEHIWTDANETCNTLIKASIPDEKTRHGFHFLAKQVGYSLIALSAALFEFSQRKEEKVTIQLAYKAVHREVSRVVDPEGATAKLGDPASLKMGLLAVWMFGGLEHEFDEKSLAQLLNLGDVGSILRALEASKEIYEVSEGIYRCGRHPAWGLLTMQAVDEYEPLKLFSSPISSGILEAIGLPARDQQLKTLTSFLLGVMYFRVMVSGELGFACTGRHMHEEFAEAGHILIDHGRDIDGDIPTEERLSTLLEIISGMRRSNPSDVEQREDLLDQAGEIMEETIELSEQHYDVSQLSELPGKITYQLAYLRSLRGELADARQLFRWSKLVELKTPDRAQYGVMSGIRESIMSVFLGERLEAKVCLDELEPTLDRLLREQSTSDVLRFHANFCHARAEIELAARQSEAALERINEYGVAAEKAGIIRDTAIYEARVALLQEDFSGAKELAFAALSQRLNANSAERHHMCYRVLGDAYLGQDKPELAKETYLELWLKNGQRPRHRDAELQLIDDRLHEIDRGSLGVEILRSTRV